MVNPLEELGRLTAGKRPEENAMSLAKARAEAFLRNMGAGPNHDQLMQMAQQLSLRKMLQNPLAPSSGNMPGVPGTGGILRNNTNQLNDTLNY